MREATRNTKRQGQTQGLRTVRIGRGARLASGASPIAQWYYLQAVATYVPESLKALAAIDLVDEQAFLSWARQWGFQDAWAIQHARRHLAFWDEEPTMAGRWTIFTGAQWIPQLPIDGWDPTAEDETTFDARIKAYKDFVKAHPALQRAPQVPARHLEWLALHHAAGWSYEQISTRDQNANGFPDPPAVCKAVKALAPLVGLTLRRKRGRTLVPNGRSQRQ